MDQKDYNQNKFKEDTFYKNNSGKKIYVPLSLELAPQFVKRLVVEATRIYYSDDNHLDEVFIKGESNTPYGLIQFDVSSNDDLNEALDKYYQVVKNRRIKLFGGE